MNFVQIKDWTSLIGMDVDMRFQGVTVCSGIVDDVTNDGKILWVWPAGGTRRLFEKADWFEAWAVAEETAVQYHITKVNGLGTGIRHHSCLQHPEFMAAARISPSPAPTID
jgi:hypothetical protein